MGKNSILTTIAFFCAWAALGWGGEARSVKTGIFLNPPFVMKQAEGNGYEGMAIDLWELVALRLGIKTEYVLFNDIPDLLAAVRDKKIDFVAINLAVSRDRAQYLYYTYPWYDAGIRIMAKRHVDTSFWGELFRLKHYRSYILFVLLFAALAFFMTVLRRSQEPGFPTAWKEGLALCLRDVVYSAVNGEMMQKHLGWYGNLFFVAWLVFGVAAVAYFTSSVTTAMTSAAIGRALINSAADLPGKTIGVQSGSIEAEFLRQVNLPATQFDNIDEAARALAGEQLDAVVGEAPALEYYVKNHPDLELMVVGEMFRPDKFSFAGNLDQETLVDAVSVELIGLRETGRVSEIKSRYFSVTRGKKR